MLINRINEDDLEKFAKYINAELEIYKPLANSIYAVFVLEGSTKVIELNLKICECDILTPCKKASKTFFKAKWREFTDEKFKNSKEYLEFIRANDKRNNGLLN